MLKRLKREIEELRNAEPGRRFREGHERTRVDNYALRIALIVVGVTLMLVAALTFWLPGPNFVLVLAGLILVAGQWGLVARLLDRSEVAGRHWHDDLWEPSDRKGRILLVLLIATLATLLLLAWIANLLGWLPGWLPFVD